MQRQRGELVPIGEVVSGLDDVPVKALREASPQARHHFTRADQVNQLVGASEADPDRGLHGAHDGAVQPAPHQPRQPASVCPSAQRPVHALVMTAGGGNKLPFGQPAAPADGVDLDRSGTDPKPRVGSRATRCPSSCGPWVWKIYSSDGAQRIHSQAPQPNGGDSLTCPCPTDLRRTEHGISQCELHKSLIADRI